MEIRINFKYDFDVTVVTRSRCSA